MAQGPQRASWRPGAFTASRPPWYRAQRTPPHSSCSSSSLSSLSLTMQALRGICWTTKTSRSGQPFAVTLTGISGRGPSTSWCLAYLTRLHASWLATERFWGSPSEPDFMLPILPNWANPSQAGFAFQSPMSYTQALPALRSALQLQEEASPGALDAQEALNFTLHGLKVGLLSPAKQLRLPADPRRKAGHHKVSSELYGRDDTIDSLWVQASVAHNVSTGWRPTRPIARGGQAPTIEPSFRVPPGPVPKSMTISHMLPIIPRFMYSREFETQAAMAPRHRPCPQRGWPPQPETPLAQRLQPPQGVLRRQSRTLVFSSPCTTSRRRPL